MIYDDPIGEEDDVVTLMFPGDASGSSPKRVVSERVGARTLVFDTPGKYHSQPTFIHIMSMVRTWPEFPILCCNCNGSVGY